MGNSFANVEEITCLHLLCDVIKRVVRMEFSQKKGQMMKILRKVIFHTFFILIIETERVMVIDNEIDVDMREVEHSVDMPIMIDQLYNLVVCEDCGIALPFEWIVGHLKENHGIKKQIVDVMRFLNMMKPSMTLNEADAWIKSVSAIKAVQNIPVRKGFVCNQCRHCT